MLCPHCGSQVPDDARSCSKCGTVFAVDSQVLASTDVARGLPEQERRVRAILIAMVIALLGAWVGWSALRRVKQPSVDEAATQQSATLQSLPIVTAPFTVKPRGIVSYDFEVPAGCRSVTLETMVAGSGDTASPPQMTVFDEAGFAAWKNRQPTRAIYTGKIVAGVLDVRIPSVPGHYHLVFAGASTLATVVHADVELNCYR